MEQDVDNEEFPFPFSASEIETEAESGGSFTLPDYSAPPETIFSVFLNLRADVAGILDGRASPDTRPHSQRVRHIARREGVRLYVDSPRNTIARCGATLSVNSEGSDPQWDYHLRPPVRKYRCRELRAGETAAKFSDLKRHSVRLRYEEESRIVTMYNRQIPLSLSLIHI